MVSEARVLGAFGEMVAMNYLRSRGFTVHAQNYYSRYGEIDLIAYDRHYVLFIEVKTRRTTRFGEPREYVNRAKQDRIRMTADVYLERFPSKRQPRFDVIEVLAPEGIRTEQPEIRHLEDAFQ